MNDDTAKNAEDDVWPPPPMFRPDIDKPTHQTAPLWVTLTIQTGFALLFSGYRVWHLWQTHQNIDWLGDVAFMGLMLFTMTTAASLWVIP